MSEKIYVKEFVETKVDKPKMYHVVIFNDDYTTMDFVVEVLVDIFHKSAVEATKIMMDVHEKGKGVVGTYPYEIACTKVMQVEEKAAQNEFPLRAGIEGE